MPDAALCYRFRGSVPPSAEVKRPVAVHRANAAAAGTAGAGNASSATIDIFDVIDSYGGWWGISAGEVDAALKQIGDVDTLYVRINSPGGEATEGVAIANILRAFPATVHITNYGLAASAASLIAVSGDDLSMAPGSLLMIHEAWNVASGNADDLRATADVLDKISESYAAVYALKGGTATDWRALMRGETWFTPEEAVTVGLADKVGVDPAPGAPVEPTEGDDLPIEVNVDIEITPAARAARRFDLSMFTNIPASALAGTKTPTATAAAGRQEGAGMDPAKLREAFGLPADASDIEVQAALATAGVITKADGETPAPPATAPAAPPEPTAPAPAATTDSVTMPKAGYDELVANAKAGAAAAQRLHEQERETFLDSVKSKFLPANRDAWRAEYDKNPQATKDWFKDAPVVLPLVALGADNAADNPQLTEDETVYASLFGSEKKGA